MHCGVIAAAIARREPIGEVEWMWLMGKGDCREGAHWKGGMDAAYGKGRLPGGSPLERRE